MNTAVRMPLRTRLIAGLALLVGIVVAIEYVVFDAWQELQTLIEQERRSQDSLEALSQILTSLLNSETGVRGFLLSGDPRFLEPYAEGSKAFSRQLERARGLNSGRDSQLARLDQVADLEYRWRTGFLAPLIEQRRQAGDSLTQLREIVQVIQSGVGKRFMDRMRELLHAAEADEYARFAELGGRMRDSFFRSTIVLMSASAAALVLVLAMGLMLVRSLRVLHQANRRLESEVSERAKAERELARSRERLDLAVQGAGLALWDYDVASGQIFLSARWGEITGSTSQDTTLLVTDLFTRIHRDDAARVEKLFRDAVEGRQQRFQAEARLRTIGAGDRWIEAHGRVVARGPQGRALRMSGTLADISARKAVETLKGEFIATVSHELRTPLTAVIGSLAVIREGELGPLDPPLKSFVDIAWQNSERLNRLVDNTLDLERIESGNLHIVEEQIPLRSLFEEAIALNSAYGDKFRVRFSIECADDAIAVVADHSRLLQVLTNLMSNAAKFSPADGVVELRCRVVGDRVRIEVADRGPGIPESFKNKIFGRFAQADASDRRREGGSGLGLSIAKGLTERMRGQIGFEDRAGGGTVFWVVFQAVADAEASHPADQRAK